MAILAACGAQGLRRWDGAWRRMACPLQQATLITPRGGAADVPSRLMWDGRRTLPLPPGTEVILRHGGLWLALSGEADSLWVMDAGGQLLVCTPCGVYPQDMCLAGDALAVCGGADSRVHLLSLPEARMLRVIAVPGNVQRIAAWGNRLCVLSVLGEERIRCQAGVIALPAGGYEPLLTLPGLPGAVCADGAGGWWIATSEQLIRVDRQGRLLRRIGGLGLIRSLQAQGERLIAADPVLGALILAEGRGTEVIPAGEICMAAMMP